MKTKQLAFESWHPKEAKREDLDAGDPRGLTISQTLVNFLGFTKNRKLPLLPIQVGHCCQALRATFEAQVLLIAPPFLGVSKLFLE